SSLAMRGRFHLLLHSLIILLLIGTVDARRKAGGRDFPSRDSEGRTVQPYGGQSSTFRQDFTTLGTTPTTTATTTTTSASTSTATATTKKSTTTTEETTTKLRKKVKVKVKKKKTKGEKKEEDDDKVIKLISDTLLDFENDNETIIDDGKSGIANKTVLVVDATYKAERLGINSSSLAQCELWQAFWALNVTAPIESDNSTAEEDGSAIEIETQLKKKEIFSEEKKIEELGIDSKEFLENWKALELNYERICELRERFHWARNADQAKEIGIDENSAICEPFKEELNPGLEKLSELAASLNQLVETAQSTRPKKKKIVETEENAMIGTTWDATDKGTIFDETTTSDPPTTTTDVFANYEESEEIEHGEIVPSGDMEHSGDDSHLEKHHKEPARGHLKEDKKTAKPKEGTIVDKVRELLGLNDDKEEEEKPFDYYEYEQKPPKHSEDHEANGVDAIKKDGDMEYYEEITTKKYVPKHDEGGKKIADRDDPDYYYVDENDNVMARYEPHHNDEEEKKKRKRIRMKRSEESGEKSEEDAEFLSDRSGDVSAEENKGNETILDYPSLRIDAADLTNPSLYITDDIGALALNLSFPENTFINHEGIALFLPGVCAGFTPKTVVGYDEKTFENIQTEGPIGVNIAALEKAGVNLTQLAEKLRNDTEVDEILNRTNETTRTLGGSFILPVLAKNEYDPYSAPIIFEGSAVTVRFGVYIESMSNFQTSTMDYDMDIYLLMAWRDARLFNPYDKPILVKEEEVLEKIWRPDPFFANAKEAEYHEVTFLNFLMRIFPDGLVLYETRIRLKTACSLVLCKYPHDKQTCELQIKSFAYPLETVRFEWFTKKADAIDKNPDVKLPELYIDRYEPTTCDKTRKSGSFACLRAVFRLKRDVGFHIAQTYIPTSLALMFSWVGVWLPEEFMEGRIGVAITVLLTLSTESAGAREHLPSVSYMKAIDLWFGFITGFVFFTLLQTLFVIAFDKRAAQLRKYAAKKRSDINEETKEAILRKADRYHKTGRYLDNFCRVFYPLSFALFLIMYYFVYTEGRQDDCINRN
ncbi:hypothetical protein PENTCL1PPCAC_9312, partial [Pristionchus entomophagus]